MSVPEHFTKRIDSDVLIGLGKIAAAEKRGHFTADDMDFLNALEWSKLPISLEAFKIAARRDGKRVDDRHEMIPDIRKCKGIYVSNAAGRQTIHVYGPIGSSFSGISAEDVRDGLAKLGPREPVDLHVHSPGGSFIEAVAIHSLIRNHGGKVHGFVDGSACSAGSLILMACHDVTMAPASEMMIHFASLEASGSYGEADLERALKAIADTNQKLIQLYKPRWKGSEASLAAALEKETYFTPAEAIAAGLADYVSEAVKMAAYSAVTSSHRTPGFSIAASEGPHKWFRTRRAALKLWQLAADEMRREIGVE